MMTTKKIMISLILCFILSISMLGNYSPQLLYAENMETYFESVDNSKTMNLFELFGSPSIKNFEGVDNSKTSEDVDNIYLGDYKNDEVFNIAVAGDWGCEEDTKKTVENIQRSDPEIVIAAGDLSYEDSADCWFEIIQPIESKMKIAMGDHEYSDTSGGEQGIINQYLKPLNLAQTYYSFDENNVHVTFIDPYIDYEPGSSQYKFIERDLKNAATNPNVDWIFVVVALPIYTAPTHHEAHSHIRDIYHPMFDAYGVDLVLGSDNHNYQRTFPLKYNGEYANSDNPIITDANQYNDYDNANGGVVYLIIGTAGRSLYDIEGDAPFVANQQDEQFGFLNIEVYSNALVGTFYANEDSANENDNTQYYFVSSSPDNNVIDRFTISNTKYQEKQFS